MFKKVFSLFLIFFFCSSLCWAGWNKPNLGRQINWSHPLSKGLVGYWLMNEGSGNRIYDLSGNKNIGTFYGDTKWASGKFGSCLSFDGDGDYVESTTFPYIPAPLTVMAWVKRDNIDSGSIGPAVIRIDYWDTNRNFDLGIHQTDGSRYPYFIWVNSDTEYILISATDYASTINDKWVHLVGVIQSNNDSELFLNGVRIANKSNAAGPANTSQTFGMGCQIGYYCPYYYFPGLIGDVMIFNRALTATEIQQLYREPFCMFEKPSLWKSAVEAMKVIINNALINNAKIFGQ